jgi:hypothetical protein
MIEPRTAKDAAARTSLLDLSLGRDGDEDDGARVLTPSPSAFAA